MRLGSTAEGGPAPAPASEVTSRGGCCEVEEGGGAVCDEVLFELLLLLSSIFKASSGIRDCLCSPSVSRIK